MSVSKALTADRSGEVEAAAAEYEKVLAARDRSALEIFLNLAILYWQATDPGLAAEQRLTPGFLALAARRYPELLEEAAMHYPESTEVAFWRRYIAWADLGEGLDRDYCRRLLAQDPTNLVPAMFLFSGGKEARAEATELLRLSRLEGTARARYIASVVESAMEGTPGNIETGSSQPVNQ